MKDYIVKTTRSLRAEWNSRNILYSLRNGFQVVYLFDVWKHGSRGQLNCQEAGINSEKLKISQRKGKKFPLNGCCCRKWILLLIILYVIEQKPELARTQTSWERETLKFSLLVILTWNGVRSCSKILQIRLKRRHILLLKANAWKTMVTVDWRPPKRRFEPRKKPFEGVC